MFQVLQFKFKLKKKKMSRRWKLEADYSLCKLQLDLNGIT